MPCRMVKYDHRLCNKIERRNYVNNYALHKHTKRAKVSKLQALAASVISRPCQERHWLKMDLMTVAKQVTISH